MKTIVLDNFIPKKDFDELSEKIMGKYFPWFYYDTIVDERDRGKIGHQFFHMHMLYDNDRPTFQTSWEIMDPVLRVLQEFQDPNIRMKTLLRVKINSFPNQGKLIEHGMHKDFPWPSVGCVFAINTCDGYTRIGDSEKIDSVANRAILFDPSISHSSTSTTNDTRRVNINFNYFNCQGNIFK
jgi:hypothetical protein